MLIVYNAMGWMFEGRGCRKLAVIGWFNPFFQQKNKLRTSISKRSAVFKCSLMLFLG